MASEDTAIFNRDQAFSRTVGFVTPEELKQLGRAKVAIAGMGGVGGSHLLTLTRLGIGNFHISDFDHFEIHNFNRQAGAMMSTIGKPKVEVMATMARDINPDLTITTFDQGVTPDNIDAFLDGVDLYVDGMDFFAFDTRELIFNACARKGIPATSVGPLGLGAALINFLPGKMSFEEYFRWKGQTEDEKGLRLLLGLAPKFSQRRYLVWPEAVDMENRKGPSTPMACSLCSGVLATEAMKIILQRGKVRAAPHSVVFDAYFNRTFHSWLPGGMNNPLVQIKLMIIRSILKKMRRRRTTVNK